MKRSEQCWRVLRKMAWTQRDRLTPDKACSARTRTRDRARWCRFSRGVRSLPFGFFSLEKHPARSVHNLENLSLDAAWLGADKRSALAPQLSGRASCPDKWGSSPPRVSNAWRSSGCSCRYESFSGPGNVRPVCQAFSGAVDAVPAQQSCHRPAQGAGVRLGQTFARHGPASL